MYRLQVVFQIHSPWQGIDTILIGEPQSRDVDLYVLIERLNQPFARIDVRVPDPGPFIEAVVWERYVVLGLGNAVYFVDPKTREKYSFECDGYFGHLYPLEKFVLVASASELLCIGGNAELLWRSTGLAIDGVVVNHVENDIIHGQAEWDPPDGWRPFCLCLVDGQALSH